MIGYRILTIDQINFKGLSDYQKELEQNGIKLVLIEVNVALLLLFNLKMLRFCFYRIY